MACKTVEDDSGDEVENKSDRPTRATRGKATRSKSKLVIDVDQDVVIPDTSGEALRRQQIDVALKLVLDSVPDSEYHYAGLGFLKTLGWESLIPGVSEREYKGFVISGKLAKEVNPRVWGRVATESNDEVEIAAKAPKAVESEPVPVAGSSGLSVEEKNAPTKDTGAMDTSE
jgi:hypothetical protein